MDIFNNPELKIQQKIPVEPVIGSTYLFKAEPPAKDDLIRMLIVDVETTGLSQEHDEVIEFAGVMLSVSKSTGAVHSMDLEFDYFREPLKKGITDEITEITGITLDDVIGKVVNLDVVYEVFGRADIVVAHNAFFDRPFVERLCPELVSFNLPWVCSCHDPKWQTFLAPNGSKFSKKGLEALLQKVGYWYDAHLAINDCIAVGWMLSGYPDAVLKLIARGQSDTYRLVLAKTPYGYNDGVKALGFRWNSSQKSWVQDFASMEEVITNRTKVQEVFGRSFSAVTMRLDSISPRTRFAMRD